MKALAEIESGVSGAEEGARGRLHRELVERAEKWLWSIGCGVVVVELVTVNGTGEIADAIGWRSGVSILVEVKTSRPDFLADRRKPFRMVPENGMGDWRFYLCEPGLIRAEEVPPGWGLLYAEGERRMRRVCGAPKGNASWYRAPLQGNKKAETMLLTSALRRLKLRGRLHEIYEPFSSVPVAAEQSKRGMI